MKKKVNDKFLEIEILKKLFKEITDTFPEIDIPKKLEKEMIV